MAGNFGFYIAGDDFPNASPESPVYMEISFGMGVVLSHTLVDQNGDDSVNQPILLPLSYFGPYASVSVAAPAETFSIVRWVKGENTVWLRIASSSSEWLASETGFSAPDIDLPVHVDLGLAASYYWENLKEIASNLPFPTRNPQTGDQDFHEALSLQFCLDLSNSTTETSGLNSIVPYYCEFFGSDAEIQPGVYQQSTQYPVDQSGTWRIARATDRVLGADVSTITKTPMVCPEGESRNTLSVDLFKEGPPNRFFSIHNGSIFTLQTPPDSAYGFDSQGVLFNSPGASLGEAEVDPSSAFELNGQTLYRSVSLIWNSGSINLAYLDLALDATLQYDCSQIPPDMFIHYQLELTDVPEPTSEAPFDGPNQQFGCGQTLFHTTSGVWRHSSLPDSGVVAHLTRENQGFTTQIIFANTGQETQSFQLYPYESDGKTLPTITRTIEPGVTQTFDAVTLLESSAASHFRYAAHDDVRVTAVFASVRPDAGPAHISASQQKANRWRIYPGNNAVGWDGAALLNNSGTPAAVTIAQFNEEGEVLEEASIGVINPLAKQLVVLSGLFNQDGAYYDIIADQPLSIVSLRGDSSGKYLWENRAIALP